MIETAAWEAKGYTPLLNELKKLGDLPLITNNWNGSSFDWKSTWMHLRRFFGANYLIHVYVSPDGTDTSKYVLKVSKFFHSIQTY